MRLGDAGDPPRSILRKPAQLHQQVDGRGHLSAGDVDWQFDIRHQRQRFQPHQGVPGAARVHGGQAPRVPGQHRLDHVERLAPPHLAHHNAVGPHPQRGPKQIADRQRPAAPGIGLLRFEVERVRLPQLQFGTVFDDHDPLFFRNRRRQGVEQRRLPRAGSARDHHVLVQSHAKFQELPRLGGQALQLHQVRQVHHLARKFANGEVGPLAGTRRNDRMHPRPVRQAGVQHGAFRVDLPAHVLGHVVHRRQQCVFTLESRWRRLQAPPPFDVHSTAPIHHHLADGGVVQVRLDRRQKERQARFEDALSCHVPPAASSDSRLFTTHRPRESPTGSRHHQSADVLPASPRPSCASDPNELPPPRSQTGRRQPQARATSRAHLECLPQTPTVTTPGPARLGRTIAVRPHAPVFPLSPGRCPSPGPPLKP